MSGSDEHARAEPPPPRAYFSLDTGSPWDRAAAWQELRNLYNGKKVTAIRDATFRARLILEADAVAPTADLTQLFPMPDTSELDVARADSAATAFEWTPDPTQSLAAEAVRRGISPAAAYLEMVLESGGRQTFTYPWIQRGEPSVG